MRRALFWGLTPLLFGCSNTTPQVGFLKAPSAPVIRVQSSTLAEIKNAAGPATLTTGDGYRARVLLQDGTQGHLQTTDNYRLEIRSLSL